MVEQTTTNIGNAPPEIPNYRLIKRVGEGAFGEVWLAEEVLTRIYRAVKIIRGRGTSKQRVELDGVRQYQQRSHGHPHLVQVLTVGQTPDCLYYVMEAADNALGSRVASPEDYYPLTLASLLSREGRLPLDVALGHTAAILDGVDHLHRNGLMHRDVKPGNILFVGENLKLGDIGLATSGEAGSAGTPGDRTPEGTAADLYAAGVILYELITGQPPTKFPELPPELEGAHDGRRLKGVLQLIDRACQPTAENRFESAGGFLGAARNLAEERGRKGSRRALVIIAILLAGLLPVLPWLVRQWAAPSWRDVIFDREQTWKDQKVFSEDHKRPSSFRLETGNVNLGGVLIVSGEFNVGYVAGDDDVMALMLATDSKIIHVIYYHKPGNDGERFDMDERRFQLPDRLRRRLAYGATCPLYLVLWPADDFFGVCDEYARNPEVSLRIPIGHLRRRS